MTLAGTRQDHRKRFPKPKVGGSRRTFAERASCQDDLARRENLAIVELQADGALAFDDDFVYFSAATDREVAMSADRGREIK